MPETSAISTAVPGGDRLGSTLHVQVAKAAPWSKARSEVWTLLQLCRAHGLSSRELSDREQQAVLHRNWSVPRASDAECRSPLYREAPTSPSVFWIRPRLTGSRHNIAVGFRCRMRDSSWAIGFELSMIVLRLTSSGSRNSSQLNSRPAMS